MNEPLCHLRDLLRCSLIATAIVVATSARAEDVCGDAADRALFSAKTWEQLADWAQAYPSCDDGYFAEHVSELVTSWLAGDAREISNLSRAMVRHPGFEQIVLRHLDMTVPAERIAAVRMNAQNRCPSGEVELCARIVRAVAALEEEGQRERRKKE